MEQKGLNSTDAQEHKIDNQEVVDNINESTEEVLIPKETVSENVSIASSESEKKTEDDDSEESGENGANFIDESAETYGLDEEELDEDVDENDDEAGALDNPEESDVDKKPVLTREQQTAKKVNELGDMPRTALIERLELAIKERPVQQLRSTVEAVKINFYKSLRAENHKLRTEFIEAGNKSEDFVPNTDELENKLKQLIAEYRQKRDTYIANLETEKENNYQKKLKVIEELKELSQSSETLNNTFAAFRELQNRWKEIGLVPQRKLKDLWDTYHHHVENFYDYVKINKELRDIDLKRNLEAKTILCEEAEALMLDPSPVAAFHKLQKLHEQWREIGPVSRELKEQLWSRFSTVSTEINKRHQAHYEGVKEEQLNNLKLKESLCEKVEEYANALYTSRKEWANASKEIIELQKVWRTIGFVPHKDNTPIYERFRAACDKFFDAKRVYFNELKDEMEDNLQIKIDLCVQAEALAESDDWKETTNTLIELQKKWKESGPVPHRHSNKVWRRFRAACDKFFERKSQHYKGLEDQFTKNLELKEQLLEEFQQAAEDAENLTFDTIKEYQRRWGEIGFVPIKMKDKIAKQYKLAMDSLFGIVRGKESDRRMERFRDRVDNLRVRGSRQVGGEREKLYAKIRQLETDIQVWENNIGFFADSKNAETLVEGVRQKINKAEQQMEELNEKLRVLEEADE